MSASTATVPGPQVGRIRAFLRLVMIEHSVFALPFALIAAFTAMWSQDRSIHWRQLVLILVAMVSARTVAMAGNRILDRHFDALNPRTANRELVTGVLSLSVAWRGLGVALAIFLASAALLGWLPLLLSPVAVGLLILYSYGKRFTDFPQVLLGLAQAVAPIGAWMGVTGGFAWPATALGLAVGTWIGGFDLIYSCQDAEIDRQIKSRSFPARFGIPSALRWSCLTHAATVACYAWFGLAAGLGPIWWVGLAVTTAVLVYEHVIVRADDLSRVNRAFFTANGFVGIQLFLFALIDLVVQGLRP
ncbi:4-hydroxybenzoate octaprenyltransferase [Jatrophihabitans telluris]|uniref:4-hydroxybenzoate octaprenyltransferase n=1 Tax=Jatrophihabitans telluris TaxID=2038343 RepID=A0ABY4R0M3_9ACTN|nr:menaquinone biosynthesis prenyltransferase MqnP [Jatrophihabitans telluris]UQX88887.1 4-hydroxybenzoate octaprenyltransferase [Jatrophihabitans telluris]